MVPLPDGTPTAPWGRMKTPSLKPVLKGIVTVLGGQNSESREPDEPSNSPETKTQPSFLMNVKPDTVVVCVSPEPPELFSASSGGRSLSKP